MADDVLQALTVPPRPTRLFLQHLGPRRSRTRLTQYWDVVLTADPDLFRGA
jgi:hypothetical protein